MKGLVNQAGGLRNFFGDGSDGAFDPSAILAAATAPNGGVVANLWDMNAGTSFTTGSLTSASDCEVLRIDFGVPTYIHANPVISKFYQMSISAGTARNIRWMGSNDAVTWTSLSLDSVSTTPADSGAFGSSTPFRYYRLLLVAGGSTCTLSIQGITLNWQTGDTQTTKVWNIIYPSALNGPAVVKQFSSLTLPAGYSMTVENPCQGLIIYCQGNAVINGTIDMSKKAGLAPNGNIIPMPITKKAKKTAKTSSLLHFNNGGTPYADDSGRTWTFGGSGGGLDTTNKKFGAASFWLIGSSYISAPASDDFSFGQDDFTIDCWARPTTLTGTLSVFGDIDSTGATFSTRMDINSDNYRVLFKPVDGSSVILNSKTTPVINTWAHLAMVRSGSVIRLYVNGVEEASAIIRGALSVSNSHAIGRSGGGYASNYFSGQIDEFRIVKGKAMWTANFTPPTSEYTYTATYTDEPKTMEKYLQLTTVLQPLKGGYGGNGGYGGGYTTSTNRSLGGTGGAGRINAGGFGGGGGGGCGQNASGQGGKGGDILYPELGGGTGQPARITYANAPGVDGKNGAGGIGGTGQGVSTSASGNANGGGSGGVGGSHSTVLQVATSSSEYAGGLLLLIIGNTLSGSGSISSNGGNGSPGSEGKGIATDNVGGGGGGGGAGGGVIQELWAVANTFAGTRSVNGGIGGAGGAKWAGGTGEAGGAGSSGGLGTIHTQQVS